MSLSPLLLAATILGFPWLVDTSLQPLPSVFTWVCLHVSVPIPLSLEGPQSLGIGPTRIQHDLLLTPSHLQRPSFQIRSPEQIRGEQEFSGEALLAELPQLALLCSVSLGHVTPKHPAEALGGCGVQVAVKAVVFLYLLLL